jgi:hypothetical protein
MAIQDKLNKTSENNDYGFNFDKAYYKIDNIRIDIARNQVNIELRGYANKDAREMEGTIGVYKKVFKCSLDELDLDGDDLITKAYRYIKKTEFSKGKDV